MRFTKTVLRRQFDGLKFNPLNQPPPSPIAPHYPPPPQHSHCPPSSSCRFEPPSHLVFATLPPSLEHPPTTHLSPPPYCWHPYAPAGYYRGQPLAGHLRAIDATLVGYVSFCATTEWTIGRLLKHMRIIIFRPMNFLSDDSFIHHENDRPSIYITIFLFDVKILIWGN